MNSDESEKNSAPDNEKPPVAPGDVWDPFTSMVRGKPWESDFDKALNRSDLAEP